MSKLTVTLVATMVLLSAGFVLYLWDSANAAKFCGRDNGHRTSQLFVLDAGCVPRPRKVHGRRSLLPNALAQQKRGRPLRRRERRAPHTERVRAVRQKNLARLDDPESVSERHGWRGHAKGPA
jgi:hypothetical protein